MDVFQDFDCENDSVNRECCRLRDLKKKNFMAPFYGWGSTASRLEPLQGGSLLFTKNFLQKLSTLVNLTKATRKLKFHFN